MPHRDAARGALLLCPKAQRDRWMPQLVGMDKIGAFALTGLLAATGLLSTWTHTHAAEQALLDDQKLIASNIPGNYLIAVLSVRGGVGAASARESACTAMARGPLPPTSICSKRTLMPSAGSPPRKSRTWKKMLRAPSGVAMKPKPRAASQRTIWPCRVIDGAVCS